MSTGCQSTLSTASWERSRNVRNTKITGLDRMRMARDQREDAIREPVLVRIGFLELEIHDLRSQWNNLRRLFQSELRPHVLGRIGDEIGRAVSKAIREACVKVRHPAEDALIRMPVHEISFADPQATEKIVLDKWLEMSFQDVSIRAPDFYDATSAEEAV